MTYDEISNSTEREFEDISSEKKRTYKFTTRECQDLVIKDPIAISIDRREGYDRHLLVDGSGSVYRVSFHPETDLLIWETDPEDSQVVL